MGRKLQLKREFHPSGVPLSATIRLTKFDYQSSDPTSVWNNPVCRAARRALRVSRVHIQGHYLLTPLMRAYEMPEWVPRYLDDLAKKRVKPKIIEFPVHLREHRYFGLQTYPVGDSKDSIV